MRILGRCKNEIECLDMYIWLTENGIELEKRPAAPFFSLGCRFWNYKSSQSQTAVIPVTSYRSPHNDHNHFIPWKTVYEPQTWTFELVVWMCSVGQDHAKSTLKSKSRLTTDISLRLRLQSITYKYDTITIDCNLRGTQWTSHAPLKPISAT